MNKCPCPLFEPGYFSPNIKQINSFGIADRHMPINLHMRCQCLYDNFHKLKPGILKCGPFVIQTRVHALKSLGQSLNFYISRLSKTTGSVL